MALVLVKDHGVILQSSMMVDEGSVKTDPYEVSSPEHVLKYLQQTDPRHNQEMRG